MKKVSEIQEEDDEENLGIIDAEERRERIRHIIQKQRSLYSFLPSSSSSNPVASYSSLSRPRKNSSLMELMKKGGNKSLRELLEVDRTGSEAYFKDYSGTPIVKHVRFRGSDYGFDGLNRITDGSNFMERGSVSPYRSTGNLRLRRTRSHRTLPEQGRTLPEQGTPRRKGFRLRRPLRIMICGTKF